MLSIFLSHSSLDKPLVRQVMGELSMMGAEPFFDEVGIANGLVINGWIEDALKITDKFVLFWSEDADKSVWVTREREAAYWRFRDEPENFLVVILDDTALPAMLAPKKYIDGRDDKKDLVAQEIMGLRESAKLIMAVQQTIETWGIEVDYIPGYGAYVGCPSCGAGVKEMEGSMGWEGEREYSVLRCTLCNWYDDNEI